MRYFNLLPAIALACCAIGCAKGSSSSTAPSQGSAAPRAAAALNAPASVNDGAKVYITNCSSCHQPNGQGIAGAFPPLSANPVVTGRPAAVIAIVKFGMSGKIVANGESYNGTMPHWGQLISDDDIAAVVSYIRSTWHNRAPAVSVADVRAVSR